MINTLFILNTQGELEVNKPEARNIKAFKVLFDRDKGSPGDASGKKQLIACRELYYIYLVYDVRSIYYNLPLVVKKEKARETANLPDNWKEDVKLDEAVETYLEYFKLSSAGKAYSVAERAYHSLASDAELIQEEIVSLKHMLTTRIKTLEKSNKLGNVELQSILEETTKLMSELVKLQGSLIDNIGKFDKAGETVKKLAAKFAEEGGSLKTPVGGGELYNREE